MEGPTGEERAAAIGELVVVAEVFAARAQAQEACRDRSTPGTGRHHQHAHSATLWRVAERLVRARILELEDADPATYAVPG